MSFLSLALESASSDFEGHLAHAYEKVIPAFQSSMKQRQFDSVRQKKLLRNKLQQARTHLLMAFHLVVDNTCLQPVLNDPSNVDAVNKHVEDFLATMSAVLGEKSDEAHYKYIQDAINSAFAAHGKRKKPKGNTNTGGRTSPDGSPCPPTAQQGTANGRALEEFDFNPEKVVSAVLEDKLPQTLQGLDFSEERDSTTAVEASEPTMVDTRHNIYDNDEFDIFRSGSVDLNRIHKGKRDQEASLDDKGTIRQLKSLYEAYGSMDVPSMYDSQMYDDEYDDTYDTNNVGADDADSADELTQRS
nr:hypothetical protein BaRGS_005888 [Batillaria attramentaria]